MPYQYVTSLNRYRDVESGRFVSRQTVLGYVTRIARAGNAASDALAGLVSNGTISAADFGQLMRDELKSTFIQQYVLGRGGRDLMQPRDWGAVGNMLREQYQYLNEFVADIESGELTEGQIRARAALYFQSSREAYERGNARAYGTPRLPAYPGDLSTRCKTGCLCSWDIQRLDGEGNYDCYWRLGMPKTENCETCLQRAAEWAPLQIRAGVLQPHRDIRASAHRHREEVL